MTRQAQWRAMAPADLDGVVRIARIAFPDHFEDRACFAERLALYPAGCFALAGADDEAAGYLIAYPWIASAAPALNSLIGALPAKPELIYLHDLAVHPDLRGGGHTRPIIDRLADQTLSDGWDRLALVAVNDATGFWKKLGFEVSGDAAMAAKLASYGPDARYMIRKLG